MPSQRGNAAYFARVAESLRECPGVIEIHANTQTASVLIMHSGSFQRIVAFAEEKALFTLQENEKFHELLSRRISESLRELDQWLRLSSNGSLDLRSIMVAGLLLLSLAQIARGQIMMPASGLLWYATQLLNIKVSDDNDEDG
jgi:hypothetical protein